MSADPRQEEINRRVLSSLQAVQEVCDTISKAIDELAQRQAAVESAVKLIGGTLSTMVEPGA